MTTHPPRAWLDDAHAAWDREARSYGPDDDEDEDADPDDTPVVPVNPYEPDSDGGECGADPPGCGGAAPAGGRGM
jgi:hypothetical protein